MSEDIDKEIFDIIFNEKHSNEWDLTEPTYDLSNIGGLDITIYPKDAKTIEEVESFEVKEDVHGSIFWSCKRS